MLRLLRLIWMAALASMASASQAAEPALLLTPPAGAGVFAPTFFGIHVHNTGPVRRWPDIPFGSIRLWDARLNWPNLEPRKGQWDFARLDEFVGWAEARRMEIVLPLGLTPRWASSRPDEPGAYGPGLAAEPVDVESWRNYVSKVSQRYRGRIAAYEIWNEANTKPFFSGTPQSLAQLTIAAAEEIRRADPTARVIAPSGVGLDSRVAWPSQLLALGVARMVDAASFHIYHGGQPPESMVGPLLKLKAFNKAAGFETVPMWNTEFGYWMSNERASWAEFERRNELSEQTAADYLPRDLLLAAALGFQRFFWYSWDDSKMGLLDPSTFAHRRIADVLDQSIRMLTDWTLESCNRSATGLWTCKLKSTNGGKMLALWVDPSAAQKVQSLASSVPGKWLRLDGLSTWASQPDVLKIVSIVTLVSDQK
jgi:hypothetical protein